MRTLTIASLAITLTTAALAQNARIELELQDLRVATTSAEVSGIAVVGDKIILVADSPSDHYLYEVQPTDPGRFRLQPILDLTGLAGSKDYDKQMAAVSQLSAKDRRFDLEGVSVCDHIIYLANERVRHVLRVDMLAKRMKVLGKLEAKVPQLFAGEANAGFEGVAADCAQGILYVAKEREPRFIVKMNENDGSVLDTFDVPPSDRSGQKVIHPWTGQGLMGISPDFADLNFNAGFLYALERNTYEIAKIDPKTKQVVARASYLLTEKGLYETGEPFGIAEALLLTNDTIMIGFDNNGKLLSHAGAQKTGFSGPFPIIASFKRPAGF